MIQLAGFIGGAYKLPSKDIACQRCVNLYIEKVPDDEKSPGVLLSTPGLSRVGGWTYGTPTDTVRQGGAYITSTGLLILVIGKYLYAFSEITEDNTLVPAPGTGAGGYFSDLDGGSETGSGPVAMSDNGIIIFLASNGWTYKITFDDIVSGAVRLQSWPYGDFTSIQYLNSRFIVNTPNDTVDDPTQNKFRVSPLDWDGDVSSWDPLAYASADQSPDALLGFIVRGSDLLLFSSQSTEFYYYSDVTPMPLIANTSVSSSIGCGAKYSIAKIEDTVFWLGAGTDGFNRVFKCSGMNPERISNPAIEQEIASYGSTDDALGFGYQIDGHSFYIITFQNGNKTWQYDLTNGLWNELSSTDEFGLQGRSRYVGIVGFQGKVVALDRISNGPMVVSNSVYDEDGRSIVRVRSSPHTYSGLNRVFYSRFQLDMETGIGLASGQGTNPLMRLRWSNDGGYNWSSFLLRSAGRRGNYGARVIWYNLGQSRNRVWEISTSEPVPIRILGAWIDAEEGES